MIKKKGNRKTSPKGAPYEAPAIVYEGLLSTRAGTLLPGSQNPDGVDPADLFGNRPLDAGYSARREVILEKFRLGEPTAATRSAQESGAVSDAVN